LLADQGRRLPQFWWGRDTWLLAADGTVQALACGLQASRQAQVTPGPRRFIVASSSTQTRLHPVVIRAHQRGYWTLMTKEARELRKQRPCVTVPQLLIDQRLHAVAAAPLGSQTRWHASYYATLPRTLSALVSASGDAFVRHDALLDDTLVRFVGFAWTATS
jgi:hypothetical protein